MPGAGTKGVFKQYRVGIHLVHISYSPKISQWTKCSIEAKQHLMIDIALTFKLKLMFRIKYLNIGDSIRATAAWSC